MLQVESSSVRSDVMVGLADRLDAAGMPEVIAAACRENLPAYRALSEELFRERVVPVIRDNFELILRVLREGEPVPETELDQFRRSAADRAAEGMALGDVLSAYRLGSRIIYGQLVATHFSGEEPELLRATDLLMQYIDQVSGAAAQAYVDELRHVVSEDERDLRALFDGFCGAGPITPDLVGRAERFGLAAEVAVHPVVVITSGADARADSAVAAGLRERGVLALSEDGVVIALSVAAPAALLPEDADRLAAYGRLTPRARLSAAVETLRNAAALAYRLGRRGRVPVSELFAEALIISSPDTVVGFKEDLLAPLRAGRRRNSADLMATMRAHLEHDLSRSATAAALHIHVNTLDRRLARIRDLTGIDLTTTDGVLRASLALKAQALPTGR